jgi:hypothetical protein
VSALQSILVFYHNMVGIYNVWQPFAALLQGDNASIATVRSFILFNLPLGFRV